MRRIARFLLLVCIVLLAAAPAMAERRVALVIGNSAYSPDPLRNPVNDARAMAAALKDLGFEVIHLENASKPVMEDAVNALSRQLRKDSVGLFFYAGHGVQSMGRNYLIPVNEAFGSEADLETKAVDATMVLERMEKAGNGLNLIILDACRNNPFVKKFRSAGGASGGLAAMQAPKGSLIAFATSPGSIASDGAGSNGVYTAHLLRHMRTPNLPLEQMFKRVRSGVLAETGEQQRPWETTSIQGDFAFATTSMSSSGQQAAAVVSPPARPDMSQESQPRSGGVRVEFAMLRENGKNPPSPITSGDTLKSGDSYFFHVKPTRDCYLYLFQVDASDKVFRLFPSSTFHTAKNPIRAGMRATLPNDREVFYLDQTTGKEEFYFLASQEPAEKLEQLEGGTVDSIMRAGLTLRGPAGVKAAAGTVKTGSTGETPAQVQEFSFSNSFVHAITINHK